MTLPLPGKITARHHERLAVVYVRQSTLAQLHDHQESTRLQYGLQHTARRLGWSPDRVLVIDDDQGKSGSSAEGRPGFQRLVAEVGLGHVGLILGLEMSRLARSNRDWHHLLEICAMFGTLIADLDGLYDPAQYNDRLLLGLKGTMSEAELHVLKQRLHQGKLNKARRGEIVQAAPIGYVKRPDGRLDLDPDEQARDVVRLIFRKFDELGTIYGVLTYLVRHGVQVPVRGARRESLGELTWQRPNRATLQGLLRNPTYAGAYVFGRRQHHSTARRSGRPRSGRVVKPMADWHVLLRDHHPAYLSWESYVRHQDTLRDNRSTAATPGAARSGAALLSGLLVCDRCGQRLTTQYPKHGTAKYVCDRLRGHCGEAFCQSITAACLDDWVARQVLLALEPASLELSLAAVEDLERERAALTHVWTQRLERARFEAERAARQFTRVEPENRLVARTLERAWEQKLREERDVREAFERFEAQQPRVLSAEEREAVRGLAQDLPRLWSAPSTTAQDRKRVVRTVVERVTVGVRGSSELVDVTVSWAGGGTSSATIRRPVGSLAQLSYYQELCDRALGLHGQGRRPREIAEVLNAEEWLPAKRTERWSRETVRKFLYRLEGRDGQE